MATSFFPESKTQSHIVASQKARAESLFAYDVIWDEEAILEVVEGQ